MVSLKLRLLLVALLCTANALHEHNDAQHQAQDGHSHHQQEEGYEEEDVNQQYLTTILDQLLQKYDPNKTGVIPTSSYPQFIVDTFVFGTREKLADTLMQLLREAATEFSKKYTHQTVDLHQFYDDIISKFTHFLIDNENKYALIIDQLYSSDEENSLDEGQNYEDFEHQNYESEDYENEEYQYEGQNQADDL